MSHAVRHPPFGASSCRGAERTPAGMISRQVMAALRGTTRLDQQFPVMHRLLSFTLVFIGFCGLAGSIAVAQRAGGRSTSGSPTSGTITPAPAPQSAIGAPMQRAPAVAPLSPSLQTPSSSSGGSTQRSTGSGVANKGSPSESAPSAPGGGGKTLQDCMRFWDRDTHMSKAEWRAACARAQRSIETAK